MRLAVLLLATLLALFSSKVAAQEELLHSDHPLWKPGTAQVWPQHLRDEESFGCVHPIKLGVWRFDRAAAGLEDPTWFSFTNYGVLHCWMNVAEGSEPGELEASRPGFLIDLGASVQGRELWALQLGARPGSDYLLLGRSGARGTIAHFEVLQRACSPARIRGGQSLDILITRYCSLASRSELVALAKRMAKRPPLGTLMFVEAKDEKEKSRLQCLQPSLP